MAYTGVVTLKGNDLEIYYKYVKEILGRPVFTHELHDARVLEQIMEKSKADFLELLQGPRPMTAEELENALDTVVWIETKDLQENSSSQYALLESYSRKYGYFYLLHLRNEHPSVYPYTNINKTWRPWNIRPTDEQRKAVAWE